MDIGLPFRLDHVDHYSKLSVPSTGEDIQLRCRVLPSSRIHYLTFFTQCRRIILTDGRSVVVDDRCPGAVKESCWLQILHGR
jgi:hypothetical protein